MRGVRVGDLQTEAGQLGGGVGQRQQDLPGADGGTARRERHGQPGEPVRVDPGQGLVQPPPPGRRTLGAADAVDGVAERQPADAQRAQLCAALQTGGQQRRQHFGQHPYGVLARAFDDFGLEGA